MARGEIGSKMPGTIPVIDVASLRAGSDALAMQHTARAIAAACREHGFFYIEGHGVPSELIERLETSAQAFFALPECEKNRISMKHGGRAWRGWFPVGGELTSGKADCKEGVYFGEELSAQNPLVRSGTPLHGENLFPDDPPEMRTAVLQYMDSMTALGHSVASGIALSLGLPRDYFSTRYLARPLPLFRIFHYPAHDASVPESWGVGAHTDYGFLTILLQDDAGGLQVFSGGSWIDAPPIAGTFVCNIGDMLDRLTGGNFVSTLHRVRNASGRSRFSYPFFFDPAYHAAIEPLPGVSGVPGNDAALRWDGRTVSGFSGTYGDYIKSKIEKVFPDLFKVTEL